MPLETYLENHLYTKAALNRIPISGTFELLPVCNLDCKMCYVKKSMSEVKRLGGLWSADDWIALGKRAVDAGMLFLLLTGGETFLFPEIEKLYTSLHKMGLAIDINSNGTLIGEQEVAWLKKQLPRHVKISLYGSSEESYQNLCGNGKAFKQVLRAFDMLKSAGVTVYSSITVTPSNYSELDEMMDICEDYKIPVKATSYMFPPTRSEQAKIHGQYRLAPEDAARATVKITKRQNDRQIFYEYAEKYCDDTYQKYLEFMGESMECGQMSCRAGFCTFWITWMGEMIPCAMMEFGKYPVMGEHDFMSAWRNVNHEVDRIRLSAKCSQCKVKEACYSCAASSYTETGRTDGIPPYVCEMTSHYMKLMKQEFLNHQKEK